MGLSPSIWYIIAPLLASAGIGAASASGGGQPRCWSAYHDNGAITAQCESNTIYLSDGGCLGPRCPETHEQRYARKRAQFSLSADNCANNAGWVFPRNDLRNFRECAAGCEIAAVSIIGEKRLYKVTGKTCEVPNG